jgi:hypothetical protein
MGTVQLERDPDGQLRLAFGSDFSSTDVPGPEVVLSARSDLGVLFKPGTDLDLGPLVSPLGAQVYTVGADDGGRRNVFVFCQPLGVEVAGALLAGGAP